MIGFTGFEDEPKSAMDYLMPFGKHRGLPLSKVPIPYLRFLYRKACEERPGEDVVDDPVVNQFILDVVGNQGKRPEYVPGGENRRRAERAAKEEYYEDDCWL